MDTIIQDITSRIDFEDIDSPRSYSKYESSNSNEETSSLLKDK